MTPIAPTASPIGGGASPSDRGRPPPTTTSSSRTPPSGPSTRWRVDRDAVPGAAMQRHALAALWPRRGTAKVARQGATSRSQDTCRLKVLKIDTRGSTTGRVSVATSKRSCRAADGSAPSAAFFCAQRATGTLARNRSWGPRLKPSEFPSLPLLPLKMNDERTAGRHSLSTTEGESVFAILAANNSSQAPCASASSR
jgi:hypothetical protein